MALQKTRIALSDQVGQQMDLHIERNGVTAFAMYIKESDTAPEVPVGISMPILSQPPVVYYPGTLFVLQPGTSDPEFFWVDKNKDARPLNIVASTPVTFATDNNGNYLTDLSGNFLTL
jgi:hypothetical protein